MRSMTTTLLVLVTLSAAASAQTSTTTCRPAWNGDLRCQTQQQPPGSILPTPMTAESYYTNSASIGESFLRGQQAGANSAFLALQAQQLALQNEMLHQQLMQDPQYARTWNRNYANQIVAECQRGRKRRKQEAQFDCMAERAFLDQRFVEGLYVLLEELPPEQARLVGAEIFGRVERMRP